ncbi:MAG: lamin tail domain-containing protein, partial [Kiritimatiellae bacterium]|nr:lamin tail domain-containing protein [Kiritimatiellia bacterium]
MNRETLTDSLFRVVRMVLVLAVAWGVSATAESATLVSRSTTWRYLKGTREASDPRSEWRTIDFDDSSWMKGAAPFGYGETGLNTTFADMQGSYSSFFLRKTFSVSSLTPDTYLRIAADYDDGFIVWVNGERVWDKNEPDDVYDRPLHDSLARSSHEGGMFETNDVADAQDYLMLGENVVAVQVFNESLASSDAKLNLELSTLNRVADTQFSHDRGFYTAPFHVTISTKTAGATIQYTLNGSDPRTASSAKIINASSGSVLIDPDSGTDRLINGAKAPAVVLRAAAFKGGYEPTNADTHTYLFLQDVIRQGNTMAGEDWVEGEGSAERLNTEMDPEVINDSRYANRMADALVSIPTLSVAMDYGDLFGNSHGIYHNALEQGEAWERAASAELINHCGRKPLQVDCGIRLQGAGARHGSWCPKRSFKLYFREEYGAGRLQYPFFAGAPENADSASDRIDKLVLRAGANKTWVTNGRLDKEATVYARDQWHRDSQIAMSGIGSHGNFVHLYLNGLYWGLYNVAERPDHGFTSDYLGGAKEDWFACNHGIDRGEPPVDGDRARFDSMHSIAKRDDLNDAARYQLISTYLNITEFCDYIILHWFAGTGDWPENNWYAGHRMNPTPEPLMYFSWDAEDCFVDTDWFAVNRANAGAWVKPQFKSDQTDIKYKVITLWRALHRNTDFRTEFADRIYEHGFNGGALTDAKSKARWASICDHIELAILGESARWGDAKSGYIDYEPDGVDPNFPYNRDDHWYPARDAVTQMMTGNADRLVEACRAYSLHSAPVYPTIDPPNFNQHGGAIAAGFKLTMSNPNGVGAITYTLDGSDPRKAGGSRIGIPYAGPMTLSKTTHVRARVYKTNGTWSAVHAATFNFTAHYSRIRITEIMYNPIGGSDYEFIEITNTGSSTRGLSDMTLKGVRYTFAPGAQLEAGRIALLVANEGLFTNRYPAAKSQAAIFGVYAGKLDNDGERVALLDSEGNTVTSVRYNDKDPWPDEPDGDGYSLVAVDPDADPDNPANWRASNLIGGSPGYDDGVPYRVVINEVLSHTDPPQVDAIELHNAGATGVDLGGWYLSDAMGELKKFRIPNGTAIAAGGYCVFDEGDFNTDTNDPACFALSSHGDEVYLSKWDANGNLVYFAEQRFGGAANGVAFGRYQRTDGEEDFVAQSAPNTLGAANAYPAVGPVVINEIMHHPSDLSGTSELSDEFIELLNISDSTVKLYDTANPANTWKLSAAVDYTFPTGTELAPDEYALLVATNASTFRSQHAIPASIQILGPYTGRLNNSGESVKLWRPDTPDPDGIPWILVDRVDYNDNSPWPESADGDGPSLERQDPRAYGNDPANWAASLNAGGTPGVPNSGGLVSKTAGWTFHDRGIDLGTAWRAASYDDSGWNDGNAPLGYAHEEIDTTVDYGEDSTAKHITTYFRKVFTLAASPDNVTDLTLCARYDDGFVAYLNGQEVVRASLPTGTIGYGTTATSHEPAGFETFGITSHKSKLVKGLNVLAVEIHQSGGSSSDLFMDIELTHTAEAANPPAAPQNLTAASASSTRINLAWQDMSGNETRFKIRRSLDGVDFDTLPPVYPAANTTTYTDSGLSPGTTYWYIIRSENAAGTSPYTDPVSATTGAGTPAAPTALAATPVSTTQIDLTWTDNADNEEIYKVYRSPDGSVWARIGTLSANTTAYSDAGLSAATAYSYKVRC